MSGFAQGWSTIAARAVRASLLLAVVAMAPPAHAITPDAPLAEPRLEARAISLHKVLRCLVCQNQSIHDSNADLARDLRRIVRERIGAGASDEAVIEFVVARYGDWVLLRPPFKAKTLVLWLGPAVILVLGAAVVLAYFRRRRTHHAAAPPLTAEERRRLDALLDEPS